MILLTVTTVMCFISIASSDFDVCRTPHICKPINECSSLFSLLSGNLTRTEISYLKKSHCGFVGKTPKVCCPNETPILGNLDKDNATSELLPDNEVCGQFTSDRIIGGELAEMGEYPWTALLKYQNSNNSTQFYCGGTLISDRYVLTATHCVDKRNTSQITVRLGEQNLKEDPDCDFKPFETYCADPHIDVPAEEIIIHENYSAQYHDIALIRLKRSVSFTEFVMPVCLSQIASSKNYTEARLWQSGWGVFNKNISQTQKMKGRVTVQNLDECSKIFEVTLNEDYFCVVNPKSYKRCSGDSGGSIADLTAREGLFYASGVAVTGTCDGDKPVLYMKIDPYVKWIVSNLRK